tara:strand:- start:2291 stop:2893 length:603 start_codon:yes stop_codon:yes gene_type:complete
MIKTINKTNTVPVSAIYPFGNIKNDDGTLNGTPIDSELLADYVQFFEKMFNKSGLVANNTPDNETNGFQLFDSLLSLSPYLLLDNHVEYTLFSQLNSIQFPTRRYDYFPIASVIEFNLSDGMPSITSFFVTFGDSLPLGTELFFIVRDQIIRFEINSTGTSGRPPFTMDGVIAADVTFEPTLEKLYKIIRLSDGWRIVEV